MQKLKKQKQPKTVSNPIPQAYIKSSVQIERLFIHPSQLIYIIIDNEGFIQLFDLPTMSLIGKSFMRVQEGFQVYRCMFSKQDVGLFYILYRKLQEDGGQITNKHEPSLNTTQYNTTNQNNQRKGQKRYKYILNINYLTKNNQIITSVCKLQLNANQDQDINLQTQLQKQIHLQQPKQRDHQTQNHFNNMQKQRNDFLKQYYNEEGMMMANRQQEHSMIEKMQLVKRMQHRAQKYLRNQKHREQLLKKQQNRIIQLVKEKQDRQMKDQQDKINKYSQQSLQKQREKKKIQNQLKIMKKQRQDQSLAKQQQMEQIQKMDNIQKDSKYIRQHSQINQTQTQMHKIQKQKQPSMHQKNLPQYCMPYLKSSNFNPILDISKYIRTYQPDQKQKQQKQKKKQTTNVTTSFQFTILYENGFSVCNQTEKISKIQLQNTFIVTGTNIYGNIDGWPSSISIFQQNQCKYAQTGTQYQDMWIIFTEYQCMLVQLPTKNSQKIQKNQEFEMHSLLQIQISQNFYKNMYIKSQNKQQYFLPDNTITQNQGRYAYNSSFVSSINNSSGNISSNDSKWVRNISNNYTDRGNRLILDTQKRLCLVMNVYNQIVLISYHRFKLTVVGKIKLDNLFNLSSSHYELNLITMSDFVNNMINFITVLRFGVNTNTTNKYQNKVMILIGVNNIFQDKDKDKDNEKQKEKDNAIFMQQQNRMRQNIQKQKEKQKQKSVGIYKPTCNVYIYSFQLNYQNNQPQTAQLYPTLSLQLQNQNSQEQLVTIFKQFPQVMKIWYSEYLQNQLSYLTLDGHVEMIDLCRLLEGKNIGKQWVNLGYRFEALDNNQQYEELEEQFQLTTEQNGNGNSIIRNKITQLNDWSYCLYSREAILSKKLKRLNIMDF